MLCYAMLCYLLCAMLLGGFLMHPERFDALRAAGALIESQARYESVKLVTISLRGSFLDDSLVTSLITNPRSFQEETCSGISSISGDSVSLFAFGGLLEARPLIEPADLYHTRHHVVISRRRTHLPSLPLIARRGRPSTGDGRLTSSGGTTTSASLRSSPARIRCGGA